MIVYKKELNPDIVFRYLGVLGGFIFKAKNLHWAAANKAIHEYLDDFWKILYDFQDAIAEGWMGIGGQLKADDVVFVAAESMHPVSFIQEVEDKTLEFYELLPEDPRFKGLSGEIESFIQDVEKYKYLFSLCFNKDGEPRKKLFSDSDTAGTAAAAGLGGASIGGIALGKRKAKKILKNAEAEKAAIEESAKSSIQAAKEAYGKAAKREAQSKAAALRKLEQPLVEEHLDRGLFDKISNGLKRKRSARNYKRNAKAIEEMSKARLRNESLELARNVKSIQAASKVSQKAVAEKAAAKAAKVSKRSKVLGGIGLASAGLITAGTVLKKRQEAKGNG